MDKRKILIQARDEYEASGTHILRPSAGFVLSPENMLAALELMRHVPDGVTPADFFSKHPKSDVLRVYNLAIAAV